MQNKCLQLHSELDMHPDAFEKSDTRKRSLRLRAYIYRYIHIIVKLHCQPSPRPRMEQAFIPAGI